MKSIATIISGKQFAGAIVAVAFVASISTLGNLEAYRAYAVDCSYPHCYAQESNEVTNWGNEFNTIVNSMTLSDYCNDLADIEQWVSLPNGDWLEIGYTDGTFNGQCLDSNHEITFHGGQINGVYNQYDDGSVTAGSQEFYNLNDADKDKIWDVNWNGNVIAHISVPYSSAIGQKVGEETSDSNAGIPQTHLWDISMLTSSGWQYWLGGNFYQDNPPLWIINCTPAYQHVHVGSSQYSSSCP
jgi:hypothetical protein